MEALFASGRIVDLVLLGVAAEAALLFVLRRRFGGFGPLAANLASGAALMLALRAALAGAPWPAVAGWMLAGLAAHAADLALRRTDRRNASQMDAWPHGGAAEGRNHAIRGAFKRGSDLKRL